MGANKTLFKTTDYYIMLIDKENAIKLTQQAMAWCKQHDAGTGSARILASIILHTYNGNVKSELERIGCLDPERLDLALGVIALAGHGLTADLVVKNGSVLIEKLSTKFKFEFNV